MNKHTRKTDINKQRDVDDGKDSRKEAEGANCD